MYFLSPGVASRDGSTSADEDVRLECAKKALEILGAQYLGCADFPDNQFDSVPLLSIVKTIEKVLSRHSPSRIFTHNFSDLNCDHRITAQAVLTATRPGTCSVKELYAFEVLSSTEWTFGAFGAFKPNHFVILESAHLEAKQKALEVYESEIRSATHPRSVSGVSALAEVRGKASGAMWAEAFELIRSID